MRLLLAIAGASLVAAGPTPAVDLVGATAIATGTRFAGVEVGGLSGIDRAADGSYLAIADDRGGNGRPPRFYRLAVTVGGPDGVAVGIRGQVRLRERDGTPFPVDRASVDPEAIRAAPGGRIYWSSEGNWSLDPAKRVQPAIVEADADGRTLRRFAIPPMLLYQDNATHGATHGVRDNASFEGLAVTPRGRLWAITERPTFDDLPADAPPDAPAPLRLTRFDPRRGRAVTQYAAVIPDGFAVSDLLAEGEDRFLAVERALPFDAGDGARVRIVRLTIPRRATNVLHRAGLRDGGYVPLARELLVDLSTLAPRLRIDNIEGLAWGPTLADGRATLLLVADNNFNPKQTTQLLLLALKGTRQVTAPSSGPIPNPP